MTWPAGQELDERYNEVSTWGHWGAGDQGGTPAHLTPQRRAQAARLVHTGVTISLVHTTSR